MRIERTTQTSLFDPPAVDHPVARELEWASAWLDAVGADLDNGTGSGRGRRGPGCETVLRCAVLLHLRQTSYRGLAFELADSLSARRFARLDPSRAVSGKSALQAGIGSIGAETWERIGRGLLEAARAAGVETGAAVRIDSTVTETHILAPSDSRLLYDGVRVLTRLLHRAREALGPEAVVFCDHRRAARRRDLEVGSQRGAKRRAKTYRKLLRVARRTRGYVESAWSRDWVAQAAGYLELLDRVMDRAERRVFGGETVPAGEKAVSLFEPHTDIIRKGGRKTQYGHKINVASGRGGRCSTADTPRAKTWPRASSWASNTWCFTRNAG